MVADPLSAHAAKTKLMGTLFIIMLVTVGLAFRARVFSRRASLVVPEIGDESGLLDTYARTSILVLLCLLGLFALGLMYGNVLGAGAGEDAPVVPVNAGS